MSEQQWTQTVWHNTLAQFVVIGRKSPAPLGMALAYRPNFQDGHAFVAVESFETNRPSPLVVLGSALFLQYLFTCWNFHKLYLELPAFNLRQFASGVGRLFEVEGQLRDHVWYDGKRWDQIILALYRQRWQEEAKRLMPRILPRPREIARVEFPSPPSRT